MPRKVIKRIAKKPGPKKTYKKTGIRRRPRGRGILSNIKNFVKGNSLVSRGLAAAAPHIERRFGSTAGQVANFGSNVAKHFGWGKKKKVKVLKMAMLKPMVVKRRRPRGRGIFSTIKNFVKGNSLVSRGLAAAAPHIERRFGSTAGQFANFGSNVAKHFGWGKKKKVKVLKMAMLKPTVVKRKVAVKRRPVGFGLKKLATTGLIA